MFWNGKRTLVSGNTLQPPTADFIRVNHYIDLHRVIPRLCVLISVALNAKMAIHDHELDFKTVRIISRTVLNLGKLTMAATLLEFIMDRSSLIFGDEVMYM